MVSQTTTKEDKTEQEDSDENEEDTGRMATKGFWSAKLQITAETRETVDELLQSEKLHIFSIGTSEN